MLPGASRKRFLLLAIAKTPAHAEVASLFFDKQLQRAFDVLGPSSLLIAFPPCTHDWEAKTHMMWVGWDRTPVPARSTSRTGLLVEFWHPVAPLTTPCAVHAQAAWCIQGSMELASGWPSTMQVVTGSRISSRLFEHQSYRKADPNSGGGANEHLPMALCSCASGHQEAGDLDLGCGTLELLFSPLRLNGVLWTALAPLGMFA
jgi:hypothetical protein